MAATGAFSVFLDSVNSNVVAEPVDEVSARKSARAATPTRKTTARKPAAGTAAARKTTARKTATRKSA